MRGAAKRIALEVLGWLLVVVGLAAIPLPGPGLLILFGGLALLSQQYEWAERRVEPVKERAVKAARESVETVPRIIFSSLLGLVLIGCGVLWIWSPPAPGWWPIDGQWWLWGGWGTGSTQIASGLIVWVTIVVSFRRFRGQEG